MSLYKIDNPFSKATDAYAQASGSFSRMGQNTKSVTEGPGKTAGGALLAGTGTAAAGATIGSAAASGAAGGSAGGYWGAAIGAVIGIGAYLMS